MKKKLLGLLLSLLVFYCFGCSNASKKQEIINTDNVYYVNDFSQNKIDNNNLEVNLNIFNITDHAYNISKATINLFDNNGNLIKQIDTEVNQTIDSYKNLSLLLKVNTADIEYNSISTILYDDSSIILEKVMDSESLMPMISNMSFDSENNIVKFDIKSADDININYFKIAFLDANLNETKSLVVNKEVSLKKDETQTISLSIVQKLDNSFVLYRLIEK